MSHEKLKEAVHVVAKIAIINYIYEVKDKKFDFINKRIKKLEKRIISLIFIEIINLCFNKEDKDDKKEEEEDVNIDENENKIIEEEDKDIDFTEMKKLIFEEFSNKLENENDIDTIINLIECLEVKEKKRIEDNINDINEKDKEKEEMINEFLQNLISKNLFTKDEYFSGNKNLKILLLYKLYEKGKIQKNEQDYYENIINLLDNIKKDIEGDIKKSKLEEF